MLFLSRKLGESIVIDKEIIVTITQIRGNSVKLSFSYPAGVEVLRKEVFERIEQENKLAAVCIDTEGDLTHSLQSFTKQLKKNR